MTVYAPSDIRSQVIPAEGAGGCGQTHVRPYDDGRPVPVWGLDCPACEAWLLAHDDRWSPTLAGIQPTYDERLESEQWDTVGAKQKDAALTAVLMQLAGFAPREIPPSVQRMISGYKPHIPLPGQLECGNGHPVPAGQPFCGECGSPMGSPAPRASLPPGQAS